MTADLLFDTNAAIAWIGRDAGLFAAIESGESLSVSLVTIGELEFGAAKSARPDWNRARIATSLAPFRRITIDDTTARTYGEVEAALRKKGRPIPSNDVWIAAIALQHTLSLVTRDGHFAEVAGLKIRDW